jgi:tripartite-type tricarboxylate transporter receptor subunit TctC
MTGTGQRVSNIGDISEVNYALSVFDAGRQHSMIMRIIAVVFLALAIAQTGSVRAQSYPVKPIRMISPFPPGGPTDILGRLMAQTLTQRLGQPVIVENRVGAGGTIGTDFVAKSTGDGYTLLVGAPGPLAINVSLFKNLPYDPLKDLDPVIQVASVPLVVIVHPSFPAKTLKELIALLKSKPDGYAFASSGNGTPQHLSGELFKTMAGVAMVHVPYKGSGPALIDVMAGQVPIMFESMVGVVPHINGARVRALATTGQRRSRHLPDVPPVGEGGVPGYVTASWYGILVSKGTPSSIVGKLNAVMATALDTPQLKERIAELGSDPVHGSPEDFRALIGSEIEKWSQVVKKSGATLD